MGACSLTTLLLALVFRLCQNSLNSHLGLLLAPALPSLPILDLLPSILTHSWAFLSCASPHCPRVPVQ